MAALWQLPGRAVRLAALEVVRAGILLDLACHRLVARIIPPQHVILGSCHRRGMCCRNIVADPPMAMKRRPWAMSLFASFHRIMHRFEVVARLDTGALIFRCGHLTSQGRCGIYRHRPRLCRNYPVLPWFGPPSLLPGCGYRTARREVAAMRPRASLAIVNPHVAMHHPGPNLPTNAREVEGPEDFHLVAEPPPRDVSDPPDTP